MNTTSLSISKDIHIDHTYVKTPYRIVVDGKTYPNTKHNHEVIREYWQTDDESVLDKLSEAVLVF